MSTESESSTPTAESPEAPTAAVLLIGNELLSGRTRDSNLSSIARGLGTRGIRVAEARVIADNAATIVRTLNELRRRHTYVFTTGGIGPTHDDITADCVADAFDVDLPIHPEAEQRLRDYWQQRELEPNPARLRMARIPVGAELVDNPVSVAPGFRIDNVFVFAGVPRIMQAMLDNVLPSLPPGPVVHSATVRCDLGEGTLAAPLGAVQDRFRELDIGSYPGDAGLTRDSQAPASSTAAASPFRVALVVRGIDLERVQAASLAMREMVLELGGRVLPTE